MTDLSTLESNKKFKSYLLICFSVICIVVGIALVWFYLSRVSDCHSFPSENQEVNFTKFGALGDFIAGTAGTLFSLSGIFLLYLTLKDQRESFYKERLENNYYELIKFHRDNVNELKYTYYENSNKESKSTAENRKVFKIVFQQFKEAFNELDHFFSSNSIDNIYKSEYLQNLKLNKVLIKRNIDLKQYAKIDIIYIIVFFGLSSEDRKTIFRLLKNKYNEEFIYKVIEYACLKPKKESVFWNKWNTINSFSNNHIIFNDVLNKRIDEKYEPIEKINWIVDENRHYMFSPFYPDNYIKYYGGHQFRLGHYYRHLYQTIKYIDDEKHLSYNEKQKYIKTLRAQLSNYEQIIFFLNSISQMGRIWELEDPKYTNGMDDNNQLITKYQLIKNIPHEIIVESIYIAQYYPNLDYEITNSNLNSRKELILLYK